MSKLLFKTTLCTISNMGKKKKNQKSYISYTKLVPNVTIMVGVITKFIINAEMHRTLLNDL